MTEIEHQETEQVAEPVEVSLPGARLRATREIGRMSRDEVAHHLHLDPQIITALEQDDYGKLPSPMYVCGYLRSYARLLKLPESEIVGAYTRGKEINAALIPENINILPGKKVFNPAILKPVILLLVAIVIAGGLFWLSGEINLSGNVAGNGKQVEVPMDVPASPASQAPVIAEQPPVSEQQEVQELTPPSVQEINEKIAQQATTVAEPAQAEVTPVAKKDGDLRLVMKEDSWVEVTDRDSVRHAYQLARAGTEIVVAGRPPYKILLGNASGVEVYYNDKLFDHSRFQRDEVAYFRIGKAE